MMENIDYSIEPSNERDFPTIAVRQSGKVTYLHSRMAPQKETDLLKSRIREILQDTVIVFGSGLGYFLKPIETNERIKKVIVIERLAGIEKHINRLFTYSHKCEYLYLAGLDFDSLENRLDEIIDLSATRGIAFLDHPASVRLFTEYYSTARNTVDRIIHGKAGNAATLKSFSSLYLRNAVKSIAQSANMRPVSSLTGLWKELPCAILSSAPSIDRYMELIKNHSEKLMLLAVDSAYPICVSHGIKPDLIITVDPQPWTEEHLIDIDPSIPVVTSVTAHFHRFENSFLSLNTHPLSQVLEHFVPDIGSVDSHTGTVAGDAIETAELLGASRIYLAGLDFSFPGRTIYGKDSAYNRRYSFLFNDRLNSAENSHEKYIRKSSSSTRIEGIRTRNSFINYRDGVSSLITAKTGFEFIHFMGCGLSIPGVKTVSSTDEAASLLGMEKRISEKNIIRREIAKRHKAMIPDQDAIRSYFSNRIVIDQAIRASLETSFTDIKLRKIQSLMQHLMERI